MLSLRWFEMSTSWLELISIKQRESISPNIVMDKESVALVCDDIIKNNIHGAHLLLMIISKSNCLLDSFSSCV
ncbi:hypothetical protein BCT27_08200 [Enterovibrio norvegicus]|nr:hypothetical protein BCT69_02475 [Enterovibrio norvegicus]PMN65394.1 hypothetical protein BCT27_08200 [Enterovibrio norvegicus]